MSEPEGIGITITATLTLEESFRLLDGEQVFLDGDGLRVMIVLDEKGYQLAAALIMMIIARRAKGFILQLLSYYTTSLPE